MTIWNITIHNIKSKPLYSFLSIFTLSLSIMLLLGIQQLKFSFKNQIENNLGNIDLVIGAKGSPLQLVLASILHLDNPTGNISYEEAKKIGTHPIVASAVPISYGDNYKNYRIVGTTKEYMSIYNAELNTGRAVKASLEVVLGATVAQKLNLKIGDTLLIAHGLIDNSIDVHSDKLMIVGVLKPTQKVIDRLIITNLESVWDVHEHEHHNHHETHEQHEDHKEITSLLVTFKSPRALLTFPNKVNKSTNMQAALPKYELTKLYEYTSVGFKTISWIAYIILVISCLTIFINFYKMVKERAFHLAILRTYGANNFQLIKTLIYEALFIIFIAFLTGVLLVKIGMYFVLNTMQINVQPNILKELPFQNILEIAMLILTMVIVSVIVAIYPLVSMNISTILSHEK